MSIAFCSLLTSGCKKCPAFCVSFGDWKLFAEVSDLHGGSSLCGWFCWRWVCSLLLSVPSQPLWVSCRCGLGESVAGDSDVYRCPMVSPFKGWQNTPWKMVARDFFEKAKLFPKFDLHTSLPSQSLWVRFSQESSIHIQPLLLPFPDILSTYSSQKRSDMWNVPFCFVCVSLRLMDTHVCVLLLLYLSVMVYLQRKRRKTPDDQPESQQENTHGDHRGSLRASQAKQFQERASLLRFFCERNLSADLYGKALLETMVLKSRRRKK